MNNDLLTSREAYLAMFAFLTKQYELGCEELGALLGALSLLPDGTPAGAALAADWQLAVAAATAGKVDAALKLKKKESP